MDMHGQVSAGWIHLARGKTDYQVVCDASVGDMDPLICHLQKPIAAIMANAHTQTRTRLYWFQYIT